MMYLKIVLAITLVSGFFLAGCTAKNVNYNPLTNISDKDAAALVTELTMSQDPSSIKPANIEVQDSNILWENDRIFFKTVTYTELLQKQGNYLVQINFKGDVFRKNDWFIVYQSSNLEDAKRYIDALSSLITARSNQPGGITTAATLSPGNALPPLNKVTVPLPIAGNSGKYMCPFTASGAVAAWAQKTATTTDNGSNLAAGAAGAAGQYAANKALEFVPFGLGGLIGRNAGEAAARAATKQNIEAQLPTMDIVLATSDVSFNSSDDLAVFMYAKYSTHAQYSQVLALTKKVYPELQTSYFSAIEKASQSAIAKAENDKLSATATITKSPQERLNALRKLKTNGLISEADFETKKAEILKSL